MSVFELICKKNINNDNATTASCNIDIGKNNEKIHDNKIYIIIMIVILMMLLILTKILMLIQMLLLMLLILVILKIMISLQK